MNNNYVIIMAGGIGSRFWPMSTSQYPKQFHDVLGTGKTLIQQTANRFKNICPPGNLFVVTNAEYAGLVKEQLPEIPVENILLEPIMRNTAPCIAYATYKIGKKDPNANMIVSPADHLVQNEVEFENDIRIALDRTASTNNLITLGIKPHRPDTGYGYIHFDPADQKEINKKVKKVVAFTEKPPIEKAVEFVASGDYFWNSGIFIWSFKNIDKALRSYLPEISNLFISGSATYNTPDEQIFINENFQKCENISIDYGIMEKSKNVEMVMTDFGWSDLGTWGSLYEHVSRDTDQNAVVGDSVYLFDASGNMVRNSTDKTLVIRGLEDYIVVQTEQATLICPKKQEQDIKQMVAMINSKTNN
jgi:mannose-1-phosphate guanylyltransferase